jgi:hypothetical protein
MVWVLINVGFESDYNIADIFMLDILISLLKLHKNEIILDVMDISMKINKYSKSMLNLK